MNRQLLVALTTVITIVLFTPYSRSQDADSSSGPDLQKLEEILEAEESLAPETRKALLDAFAGMAGSTTDEAGSADAADGEPSLWERIVGRLDVYGDIRLRHESNFELDSQRDRHRERIRLRLGATYAITDELTAGARVTTGNPQDPNSPHVTIGSGFDRFDFNLDRAYLAYEPDAVPGLRLTGGKFGHPFVTNPVYGELLWDADVQPEGAIAEYVWKGDGVIRSVELRLGEYVVLEQSGTSEVLSTVGQIATRFSAMDDLDGLAAVGYSFYTDPTPGGSQDLIADDGGNALLDRDSDGTPDDFLSDFGILHPILAFTYRGACLPLTLSAEYFWNTRADTSKDQGVALGVAVGEKRKQGDWRFFYQWQLIQQDAVFSPFVQDDFLLATNHDTHAFGVNYQAFDQVGIRTWALVSQRDRTMAGATTDSGSAQWRVRLDINVSF